MGSMGKFMLIGYAVPEEFGIKTGIMKGELFSSTHKFDLMLNIRSDKEYYVTQHSIYMVSNFQRFFFLTFVKHPQY